MKAPLILRHHFVFMKHYSFRVHEDFSECIVSSNNTSLEGIFRLSFSVETENNFFYKATYP